MWRISKNRQTIGNTCYQTASYCMEVESRERRKSVHHPVRQTGFSRLVSGRARNLCDFGLGPWVESLHREEMQSVIQYASRKEAPAAWAQCPSHRDPVTGDSARGV